jgi:uncharacterized protein
MPRPSSDVAFTPSVKSLQESRGSRAHFAKMEATGGWRTEITADLAAFLAGARSFYLATASTDGQPYVQHRGGPPGFLRVLDEHTLGFADFKGKPGGKRQGLHLRHGLRPPPTREALGARSGLGKR